MYPVLQVKATVADEQVATLVAHCTQETTVATVTKVYPVKQVKGTVTEVVQEAAPEAVQAVQTVPAPIKENPLAQAVATVREEQTEAPDGQAVQTPAAFGPKYPAVAHELAIVAEVHPLAPTPQVTQAAPDKKYPAVQVAG